MDDGYTSGNGVILCTDSFTLAEVELLLSVLIIKFKLIASLHRKNRPGKPVS